MVINASAKLKMKNEKFNISRCRKSVTWPSFILSNILPKAPAAIIDNAIFLFTYDSLIIIHIRYSEINKVNINKI